MSRAVARWLEGVWYQGRRGAALLAPLAAIFAVVVGLRRSLFQRGLRPTYRASVPVIVVGNLSVGGTGKSPLVALLARLLRARGLRPAVLTRGYGVHIDAPTLVTADTDPQRVGDEPVMLSMATGVPVMVSPDRAAGARALEALGIDVILCDDGLQHYALARDLEIVVIDAARGFGNGRLLPAGPLRETPARLETVDWVVVNGNAEGSTPMPWRGRAGTLDMQLVPEAPRNVREPRQWRSIESFRGATVHAVAAIGHPSRFFAMLRAAGLELIEHPFADHHAFSAEDFAFGDTRAILMTAKDAVKCAAFADARFWEVPAAVRLGPDGGVGLVESIVGVLQTPLASRPSRTG